MKKIILNHKDLTNGGLEIHIEGATGNPIEDPGCVAFIEYYEGKLRVCLWDNSEDPEVIEIKHYSPDGSSIDPLYCPTCQQMVKKDPLNKSSLADQGRCTDCQILWKNGNLIEQEENSLYSNEDWIREVANGDTNLGYKEWVEHRIEADS